MALIEVGIAFLWGWIVLLNMSFAWPIRPNWHNWLILTVYAFVPLCLAIFVAAKAVGHATDGELVKGWWILAVPPVAIALAAVGMLQGLMM